MVGSANLSPCGGAPHRRLVPKKLHPTNFRELIRGLDPDAGSSHQSARRVVEVGGTAWQGQDHRVALLEVAGMGGRVTNQQAFKGMPDQVDVVLAGQLCSDTTVGRILLSDRCAYLIETPAQDIPKAKRDEGQEVGRFEFCELLGSLDRCQPLRRRATRIQRCGRSSCSNRLPAVLQDHPRLILEGLSSQMVAVASEATLEALELLGWCMLEGQGVEVRLHVGRQAQGAEHPGRPIFNEPSEACGLPCGHLPPTTTPTICR